MFLVVFSFSADVVRSYIYGFRKECIYLITYEKRILSIITLWNLTTAFLLSIHNVLLKENPLFSRSHIILDCMLTTRYLQGIAHWKCWKLALPFSLRYYLQVLIMSWSRLNGWYLQNKPISAAKFWRCTFSYWHLVH